jgi:hypothetical protein
LSPTKDAATLAKEKAAEDESGDPDDNGAVE